MLAYSIFVRLSLRLSVSLSVSLVFCFLTHFINLMEELALENMQRDTDIAEGDGKQGKRERERERERKSYIRKYIF